MINKLKYALTIIMLNAYTLALAGNDDKHHHNVPEPNWYLYLLLGLIAFYMLNKLFKQKTKKETESV